MASDGLVLSLCDRTGNMVRPWAEAGYDCIAVDQQHDGTTVETVGNGTIRYVEADITTWLPPRAEYTACFAFPPCTNLAVSGAKHFKDKGLDGLDEGVTLVQAARRICRWTGAPWMLENPVSTLSSYWRKPDYTFDPYEFDGYTSRDEKYTKKTCLWTSDEFEMPDPHPDADPDEADDRIHSMGPSEDRGDVRSETPMGFARAVFEANAPESRTALSGDAGGLPDERTDVAGNILADGGIIPGKEGVVLIALRLARERPEGFKSGTVTERADVSDRTVRRVLNSLRDAGVLAREENGRTWYRGPAANDLIGAPMPR